MGGRGNKMGLLFPGYGYGAEQMAGEEPGKQPQQCQGNKICCKDGQPQERELTELGFQGIQNQLSLRCRLE